MLTNESSSPGRIVGACFLAGIANGAMAPILILPFSLLNGAEMSSVLSAQAILAAAFFGAIFGLVGSLLLGVPVLVALARARRESMAFAGILGALMAVGVALVAYFGRPSGADGRAFGIVALFAVHGFFTGALASWLLQHNKSLNTDAGKAGAG